MLSSALLVSPEDAHDHLHVLVVVGVSDGTRVPYVTKISGEPSGTSRGPYVRIFEQRTPKVVEVREIRV